jgi:hypothetical protein
MVDTQVIKERTLLQELACKDDIFSSGPLQRNRGHDVLSGNPTRYCLDRDWRKAVFHLLNNAAKKLQLPLPYRDLGEKRFDVKVLPVSCGVDSVIRAADWSFRQQFSWFYVQNLHELVCGENESQCPRDMKESKQATGFGLHTLTHECHSSRCPPSNQFRARGFVQEPLFRPSTRSAQQQTNQT